MSSPGLSDTYLASWLSWRLSFGTALPDAVADLHHQYRDQSQDVLDRAVALVQAEIDRTEQYERLLPFQPVASAFPVGQEPTTDVGVVYRVAIRMPDGTIEYRTFIENASPFAERQEVERRALEQAAQALANMPDRYRGARVATGEEVETGVINVDKVMSGPFRRRSVRR